MLVALIFVIFCFGLVCLSSTASLNVRDKLSGKGIPGARVQAEGSAATCPTCAPPRTQVIYAPLIDLAEAASSEIVLNCRSAHEMDVTPTFYTVAGEAFVGDHIYLQPAEMRFVDTKSLIPARERQRHRWGGMTLTYTGNLQEAWAQLTLKGLRGGGSANVFFAVVDQPRANSIEAVWWMPRNADAVIALGNSSNQAIHANLLFGNGESRTVDIDPFATELLRTRGEGLSLSSADRSRAETVSINYTGAAGSLIPAGYIGSAREKFTSTIRFYNPPNTVQANLYANNLRLQNATPHMLLKNTSAAFIEARPKILNDDGSPIIELPAQRLAPSEVVEVNLRPLLAAARSHSDTESVSVQVLNDGAAGSLIGALYTQDDLTGVTCDVPLRDSGPPRSSTGAYPVRLDHDYTTVLAITNTADKPGDLTLQINYPGGPYQLGLVKLQSGETKSVDIRKLRDEQTPDTDGHALPLNLTTGQIRWSIRGNGSVRMTGRAEIVSLRDGVSSSYSCTTCCPSSHYDAWLDPGYFSVFIDDFQTVKGKERQRDCYGNIYGPYDNDWGNWYSANPDIATVSNGDVTGVSGGTAGFWFTYPIDYWFQDFDEQCIPFESTDTSSGSAEVPSPEIVLNTAQIHDLTAQFVGVGPEVQVATLNVWSSAFEEEICGNSPQQFALRVNFTLPEGGQLVQSRCSAKAFTTPTQNYNVGTATCTMDAGLEGHLSVNAQHRCCGGPDTGITVIIGANKSGQTGTIDTRGSVKVKCNQ